MEFVFIFKAVVIMLVLGGLYEIRKLRAVRNAQKKRSLVQLLKRRALEEAEECQDGIAFRISDDKHSLICYFPLETLMAQDATETDEFPALWLLQAIKIPHYDNKFVNELFQNKSNWGVGIEFFVDIDEVNNMISIKAYTDIDFTTNPMGQLESYIDLLKEEAFKIRRAYERFKDNSERGCSFQLE